CSCRLPCVQPRLLLIFFFSSRRRHTRSKRDWSSDVCSSDLHRQGASLFRLFQVLVNLSRFAQPCFHCFLNRCAIVHFLDPGEVRSEERRVGKESGRRGGSAEGMEKEGLGGEAGRE